eukprot:XP_003727285.1 PREDICTED: uncharacterized protein LOC100890026 [Strongylocentrotus purpuratus]
MESNQIDKMRDILDVLKKTDTSWASSEAALLCEQMDAAYWKSPDKIKFCQEFCDYDGAELLVSALIKFEEDGLFKVKGAWETAFVIYNHLCNLSEASLVLSIQMGEKGMVKLCSSNIVKYRGKMSIRDILSLIRVSLGILCNMSTTPGNRHLFREEGVAEKMQPYLKGDPFLKTICMITLAYIIEEGQEDSLIEKETDTIEYLVGILRDAVKSPNKRFQGLCDREIALALGRLAVHDSSKCKILKAGGLPLLVKMLEDKSADTQEAAANTIWNLAFSEDGRQKIAENKDCLKLLESLTQCSESHVADAAKGALWVITQGQAKQVEKEVEAEGMQGEEKSYSHIMISYQWGSQPVVLTIRDALKAAGYQVWLDVDHMHGSTLQAMAEAVEKSYVVLMCISEGYKESPNCRTEAEYTFKLGKCIIPVMMEEYYQPDGWLGIILGSKLYMDFSGKLDQTEEMKKLLREVQTNHADAGDTVKRAEVKEVKLLTQLSTQPNTPSQVLSWSNEQVQDWLKNSGLDKWRPSLQEYDGTFLFNLHKLRLEAPEFFYSSIQDDQGLQKLREIFKFTAALETVMKK